MTYTVGSLFSGIGGIDLAATWAGFDIAWQVELDEYCREVLTRHWPDVPKFGDVRGVTGRSGKGWRRYQRLAPVDVMVGGFPCQDISTAGKGAGIHVGTRSGLWYEFARLIGELRPRVVLLENVPAIAIRGGVAVIGSLADLGYSARWGTIRASDAGAPHKRERWFCVAYHDSMRELQLEGSQRDVGRRADHGNREMGNADVPRLEGRRTDRRNESLKGTARHAVSEESRRTESRVGGTVNGLPRRLDDCQWPAPPGAQFSHEPPRVSPRIPHRAARLRALGNAVVPDVVYPLMVMIREMLDAAKGGG